MKTGMRAIIYSATLLGWVQPGLAANCLCLDGLTKGNSLAYYFTLGIMLGLLVVILGLKMLYQNKLKNLAERYKNSAPVDADVCQQLKIGQNFSKWTHVQKVDEVKPTGS